MFQAALSGDLTVTFQPNKSDPVHRWYPYLEGFSGRFVAHMLDEFNIRRGTVLDPFSGCGTTPFEAFQRGLNAVGLDINPVMQFVADVKTNTLPTIALRVQQGSLDLVALANHFLLKQMQSPPEIDPAEEISSVFLDKGYFALPVLHKIAYLKRCIRTVAEDDESLARLLRLALAAVLVDVSNMTRRADLRFRRKRQEDAPVFKRFSDVLAMMSEDVRRFPVQGLGTVHNLLADARTVPLDGRSIDIVVTSPPYLNGTNYIRNTKLELWILDYLRCEEQMSELHGSLLTAGINTVRASQETKSSFASVAKVVQLLEPIAYDRRIPLMVVGYFEDMFTVFTEVWRVLKPGGKVVVVVGDSAFSGIHVPTDRLLGEIGQIAGLQLDEIRIVRTRRSRGGMALHESVLIYTKE